MVANVQLGSWPVRLLSLWPYLVGLFFAGVVWMAIAETIGDAVKRRNKQG
jgi:hypothetical protein